MPSAEGRAGRSLTVQFDTKLAMPRTIRINRFKLHFSIVSGCKVGQSLPAIYLFRDSGRDHGLNSVQGLKPTLYPEKTCLKGCAHSMLHIALENAIIKLYAN